MSSEQKIPCIPLEGVISYEDWLRGRRARRESSQQAAPGINRRARSSKDKRLRRVFHGERGLPFAPTEKL